MDRNGVTNDGHLMATAYRIYMFRIRTKNVYVDVGGCLWRDEDKSNKILWQN